MSKYCFSIWVRFFYSFWYSFGSCCYFCCCVYFSCCLFSNGERGLDTNSANSIFESFVSQSMFYIYQIFNSVCAVFKKLKQLRINFRKIKSERCLYRALNNSFFCKWQANGTFRHSKAFWIVGQFSWVPIFRSKIHCTNGWESKCTKSSIKKNRSHEPCHENALLCLQGTSRY